MVPIPTVYAIIQSREKQRMATYILMHLVPGTMLLDTWTCLDRDRKTTIAKTLQVCFDQPRQLSHPGYFGNIDGGPPLDDMFSATQGADEIKTSCEIESELIDCIMRIYSLGSGECMAHKTRYYQHVLTTVLRGYGSPVFIYSDLQRENVMVQPDGLLAILDWEFASWYPTYWEYSTATYCNSGWDDDWHECVRMVLDEYPTKSLWLSNMKFEIWT